MSCTMASRMHSVNVAFAVYVHFLSVACIAAEPATIRAESTPTTMGSNPDKYRQFSFALDNAKRKKLENDVDSLRFGESTNDVLASLGNPDKQEEGRADVFLPTVHCSRDWQYVVAKYKRLVVTDKDEYVDLYFDVYGHLETVISSDPNIESRSSVRIDDYTIYWPGTVVQLVQLGACGLNEPWICLR